MSDTKSESGEDSTYEVKEILDDYSANEKYYR